MLTILAHVVREVVAAVLPLSHVVVRPQRRVSAACGQVWDSVAVREAVERQGGGA